MTASPEHSCTALLKRAKTLFEGGDLTEAEILLREGEEKCGDEPSVATFRAYLLYRLGRIDEAEDAYRRLTKTASSDPSVFSNLGLICLKLRKIGEAAEAFAEVLRLQPEDQKARRNLDHCRRLLDTGEGDGAPLSDSGAVRGSREEAVRVSVPPLLSLEGGSGAAVRDGTWLQEWMDAAALPQPGTGREVIRTGPGGVAWHIDEKIYLNRRFLSSHRGVVVFSSASRQADKAARRFGSSGGSLLRAEGSGEIILSGCGASLNLFRVEEGMPISVNFPSLVACGSEATLSFRQESFQKGSFLVSELTGADLVILAVRGTPTVVEVPQDLPTFVRVEAAVAWTGELDFFREENSLPGGGLFQGNKSGFLKFEGRGHILLQELPPP